MSGQKAMAGWMNNMYLIATGKMCSAMIRRQPLMVAVSLALLISFSGTMVSGGRGEVSIRISHLAFLTCGLPASFQWEPDLKHIRPQATTALRLEVRYIDVYFSSDRSID